MLLETLRKAHSYNCLLKCNMFSVSMLQVKYKNSLQT